MARPLRIEYDGAVYHVTARGNARNPIFEDEEDRICFLDVRQQAKRRYNRLFHAYCLMDNHYHLVVETPDGNLSGGMRQVNGVYTQLFNKRHKRVGHVFQGRYKAILIEKETHLLEVCRYVVLNPVRATIVEDAGMWKWSSYRSTAGKSKNHEFLTTEWIMGQFGDEKDLAQKRYREFVRDGTEGGTIWAKARGQSILGEEDFVATLAKRLKKSDKIKEIPRMQRYLGRPGLREIFSDEILQKKRLRDQKILESVEKYGYSQKEIADFLHLHYSTISRLINEGERKHQD